MNILLEDESASIELGRLLSDALQYGDEEKFEIHLEGNLGAGKTTIARSLINGLGWQGKVKSPTYTIYEEYQVKDYLCKHIDLYRIDNQEDVDMLDLETVSEKKLLILIEWPENLPNKRKFDLKISIVHKNESRLVKLSGIASKIIKTVESKYA